MCLRRKEAHSISMNGTNFAVSSASSILCSEDRTFDGTYAIGQRRPLVRVPQVSRKRTPTEAQDRVPGSRAWAGQKSSHRQGVGLFVFVELLVRWRRAASIASSAAYRLKHFLSCSEQSVREFARHCATGTLTIEMLTEAAQGDA